ncbi:MAG: hypothetical protein IJ456_05875 [Bacteroides sp.]|nr:hypothetical protein [Bacteroides sp.]
MANANNPSNYKRTAHILTGACGILFFAFSFVWLYVFQRDVMEALHFSLSDGKTEFTPFWCAFVLTVVLLLLRWGVNALLGLKGVVRALSYFPSFLLLGVMTDVDYSVYQSGIADRWMWLLPLALAGYALLVFVLRRILGWWLDIEVQSGTLVNCNLFIFLMLTLMTVGIGNTNIHFHHELAVESALRRGQPEEVRRIGAKVVDPSRLLTSLRCYALSKEGKLGEYLFQTPQLYGAEGLLPDATQEHTLRMTVDSLYTYLGGQPWRGEKAVSFFRRLCNDETGNHTTLEYYLSALLLDKQLPAFVEAWHSLYEAEDSLPHRYKEALFLYEKMHPSVTPTVIDEAMNEQWHAYDSLKHELSGTSGEGNYMRRKFGDTYWWYYQYN